MLVEATRKGFFEGELRKYNEDTEKGDRFTINSRLPKGASKAKHAADIKLQFSDRWMVEVEVKKEPKPQVDEPSDPEG